MKLLWSKPNFSDSQCLGPATTLCAVLLLLAGARSVEAQVFELSGGSSTLFHAHGGSVHIYGSNYTGQISLGLFDQPRVGFFLTAAYRGFTWGLGDQPISFVLPTDLFNRSYYFLGTGLSAARRDDHSSLFFFAGATSTGFVIPFMAAGRPETGAAVLFYERQLAHSVRFFSHNVFSARQTAIQGIEWKPRDDLKLAIGAGLGSNQRYAASSLDFNRNWISLKASYTAAGRDFRRIRVASPLVSETDRENVVLDLTPLRNLRLTFSRQNLLAPASNSSNLRATVNGFSASGGIGGFQLYGSLFESESQGQKSRAMSLGGRRSFWNRVDAGVNYLRTSPRGTRANWSVVTSLNEMVTRRIRISQIITRSNGQTTVAFGGSLLTNRLSVGLDYQTVFLPFALPGQSQFKQALVLNLRLQLPRNITLNALSNVTPLGQVRYTGYVSTFAYRNHGGPSGIATPGEALYKNIVRGRVVDERGQPVEGAALRIDGDLVFTDSQGTFFVRKKKPREYRLEVLLDQFMFPGQYQLISGPTSVKATKEEVAGMYEVVLRRLPSTPPAKP